MSTLVNFRANERVIHTDVLIIGGGSAGLWVSNRIKELNKELDVLVVDKGPQDWGGLMAISGGDFDAVLPHEDVNQWVEDLVYYWDGLCDQELMEEILSRSYDRLCDYEKLGCEYLKNPDGSRKGIPQRGLKHFKLYPAKFKGKGGEDMAKNLIKHIDTLGVKRLGRILITEFVKKNDCIIGAVGFNSTNGDFYYFKTRAVVLTTGAGGWKTSYGKNTPTGEGIEMAFKAGADLKDFEFGRVWNVPRLFGWEGQTTLMPLGARYINALGEPFMEKYSPLLGANTDPHYITLAMAFEARAGRAPLFFDISRIKPENLELVKPQTGWQLLNYNKLSELGLDLFNDNTEWIPQLTISFGGVHSDIQGKTTVNGLFAAGTARSIEPGVYIGGFALMTTSVTGYMTGETVVDYLKSTDNHLPSLSANELNDIQDKLYSPIGKKGMAPKMVLREIQKIVFPYDVSIIKSEHSLLRALKELEQVQNELIPEMVAEDPHYLLKLREVQGIAFITELYLKASLMRKESRGGHFREDYPTRNEENGLCWIIIRNQNGAITLSTQPLPANQYKHKITRYYSDNFTFGK
jgi:succinate dehydrogenase/fumarate reductase flavoprotein subunit